MIYLMSMLRLDFRKWKPLSFISNTYINNIDTIYKIDITLELKTFLNK